MQPSPSQSTHLRAYMLAAALVPLSIAVQEAMSHRASTAVVAARLAMSMIFFAAAFPAGSRNVRVQFGAVRAALLSVILVGTLPLVVDGGSEGPWIWFVAGVPLYVALFLLDRVTLACTGAATIASGLTAMVVQATPPGAETMIAWGLQSVTAIAFGAWGVTLHERRIAAEEEARRASALAEKERGHSERLATVGRMVAGVAHEINNPLAVVHANISFLREDLASGERSLSRDEEESLLSDTAVCAERIRRLVKDMQAFTRRENSFGISSLDAAVDASTRLARAGAAATVTIDVQSDGTKPRVAMEQARLEQALLNIYANAVDALRRGAAARPHVTVSYGTAGAEAWVRIHDNGPGIAADVLLRVFEPFFTTKPPGEGPGLGLSIAREYVAQAGGRITAANAPEGGAVFEVSLPLAPDAPPGTREKPASQFIES